MTNQHLNRLSHETSPYLQQHGSNPVDWYPWSQEALEVARQQDKPILLSIGYSACHWCHVMAHESFEDTNTAELMNGLFVNIKVDREERPDIDKIYQLAHQLLTQKPGGWPLNMFLTPHEHIPYFGGTYFPPDARYNTPAFASILQQAANFYHKQKDAIKHHNAAFAETIESIASPTVSDIPDSSIIDQALSDIGADFDSVNGGFGHAPKFPHPTSIELLFRCWHRSEPKDEKTLEMTLFTLEKMALGGIYDQLGGGFCRYSVDNSWHIPHFEKMLYDNGPLLALYAQAWQITGKPLFKKIALETAEWALREMQSPEGGFYSSLDADSEGVEGKFYAWGKSEVEQILTLDEFNLIKTHFGLDGHANFDDKWHFYVSKALPEAASYCDISLAEAEALLISARQKLFNYREKRVHPGRDEKILTSWNALMIKGLAIAGRIFDQPRFINSAQIALDFLYDKLWKDERLLATYKDGKAHLNAYLDDYAYLIDACIEMAQSRWHTQNMVWAEQLADTLLDFFEDPSHGGFFFTSNDHETLIHRPKPMVDEAIPAGNGVAAYSLTRLGLVLGKTEYLAAAERTLAASSSFIQRAPQGHCSLLIALDDLLLPPDTIVIRGIEMDTWYKAVLSEFNPHCMCFAIPNNASELPGQLADRTPIPDTVAYVCTENRCLPPFTDFKGLQEAIDKTKLT